MASRHLPSSPTFSSTTVPRSFQRQANTEDEYTLYSADCLAAVALRGLTVCSTAKTDDNLESDFFIETPDVHAMQNTSRTKRVYKKRKASSTVRKEEMEMLESELSKLQNELERLKFHTLVNNDDENYSIRNLRAKNALYREAVQERHFVLARAQAMLAGHAQQCQYRLYPIEMKIRLGTDQKDRRKTLSALRGPKLKQARRYLMERMQGLSTTAPYFQEERYDTTDGDFCITRFDVTPFRGTKGVLEVFSALKQAVFNAEIIISESSGNITIREDDELEDDDLSHMRFLSHMPSGVQLESNLVLFSERAQCQTKDVSLAENGCYAIMASDFVNDDMKYPYKPNERIRRDLMSATMVTSYQDDTAGEKDEGELVVVVTRWALNIVRCPAISVPSGVWDELRDSHLLWADLMFKCVRQALGCR